ncbi:hemerythrin domain-containing protein [Niabella drilacis]|uniref:Hemerythrin HHE cation binding domain-containing protein n=1 Tax=Niabella drilacis (strain DSM 25811 / CCM 8410 / CCUG 62505 / LMG 26954 / E90) TaxID=1285928 RepID=A0A1G6IIQ8_NIADE|nr:hemerythrin domain-containing protein [Niabella drilacis]SDC06407.1 Hemerythrin HHE cation binding domain-containing protein [Niabella drilacis]
MKRHESIVPLSRDHHHGLLCCWKIRQGIKKKVAVTRIGAYIRYFWDIHLKDHFDEEEQWLFVAGDAQCAQAIAEHRRLQALQETIAANAVTGDVEAFADLLDRHIRFEERILFPHLEQTLSAEKMAVIGTALEASHKKTGQDDYPDAFWLDT